MEQLHSFRETKLFTKRVLSLLTEESYFAFQNYLQENFLLGDLIPGGERIAKDALASGGERKERWCSNNLLSSVRKRLYLFDGDLCQK